MEYIQTFVTQPHEKRILRSTNLKTKYPDRAPFVLDRATSNTPNCSDHLFLIPLNTTIQTLFILLRSRVPQTSKQGLFLYIDNTPLQPNKLVSEIAKCHTSNDGFIYITYAVENVFGRNETLNQDIPY